MTEFDPARVRTLLAQPDEEARRRALAEIPEGWAPGALGVLIEALGDDSWRVRKEAVERLARWPDRDGAIPMLIAVLADDANVGLRNAAVEALGALGAASVGPLVTALVAGGEQRKFLIDALGAIGDPAAVPALVACLADADENLRAAAAEALGAIGGEEATRALRSRLTAGGDGDVLGRLAALEALVRLAARVPAAELEALLAQPILRHGALEALGHSGDLGALPHLVAALDERSRTAREAAQVALHALHEAQEAAEARARVEDAVRAVSDNAVTGMIAALSSDSLKVRRAAAALLGWGRWPVALARLVDALCDEEVHAAAAQAIVAYGAPAVGPLTELAAEAGQELRGEIFVLLPRLGGAAGDARVEALLGRALEDEDTTTATAAARALGDLGGKDSLGALFHALARDDDPALPTSAAQALAKLGGRHGDEIRILLGATGIGGAAGPHLCRILGVIGDLGDLPLLLAALRADDPRMRRAAAEAVGAIGARHGGEGKGVAQATQALVLALADEDGGARAAAAEALGALGDTDALPALLLAANGEDPVAQAAAVRALGSLGDARAAPILRELVRSAPGMVAVHAAGALGRLPPSPADEEALIGAVGHQDPEVVKAAVAGLAARSAAHLLGKALDHPRWDVRRLCARALTERAAAEPAVRALLEARLRVEEDALVREALAVAVSGEAS